MKIEIKNDEMLGKTNEITLHIELMKLQQENQQLKENYKSIDKGMAYLMEQNIDLQQRIDKAIEYIKKRRKDNVGSKLNFIEVDTVLEILKGSDSDE